MFKQLIYIFLLLISMINCYSIPTEIDSCQNINSTFTFTDISDRTILLNKSINTTGDCLKFENISNFKFSCQNETITGNLTNNGILIYSFGTLVENSSFENCNINNFKTSANINFFSTATNFTFKNINISNSITGIKYSRNPAFTLNDYHLIENINIYNLTYNGANGDGTGIHIPSSTKNVTFNKIHINYADKHGFWIIGPSRNININNSVFENLDSGIYCYNCNEYSITNNILRNNLYGLYFTGFNYDNIFENISIYNNNFGIYLIRNSNDNLITKSSVYNNSVYEIYFDIGVGDAPINNIIFDNYLGNFSKIQSEDWNQTSNNFTHYGIGNTYLPNSVYNESGCFENSIVCDNLFIENDPFEILNNQVINDVSINSLPSLGLISTFISILLIGIFLN